MTYLSQSQLGWDHFIRGRLSLKWERIIKSHLQRNGISNITAEQWGSDLLQINWEHIIELWLQGNIEVHESSEAEQTERRKNSSMKSKPYNNSVQIYHHRKEC
jgi:hypothetical protein